MRLASLFCAALLLFAHPVWAQPVAPEAPASTGEEARRSELRAAMQAAERAAITGPTVVPLAGEATLRLPEQMSFVPKAEADRLSRAFGNRPGPNQVGMITRFDDDSEWLVIVTWVADGYVRDDEAKDIDPAAILDQLREGTTEANKDRASRGFPALEVVGWTQEPSYDAATHRLAWAVRARSEQQAADDGTINFNTRALGRYGYFSLNLLTGIAAIERDRAVSATLLANLDYDAGHRYADFDASSDHVAAYGLAALLGVVAVKKLGLLALAGVFLLKFAKIGVLAVAGVGLAVRRLFRRKPAE